MVPREGASAGMVFLLNIAAFVAIFYFLLIRPQRQEAKRHQEMLASLKKGDEIVTSGGIIGTVVHAADDRLTVKSGDNTRFVVQRARVAGRMNDGDKSDDGKK
ncbi:MAG: preprotein translocase subunit YajC [Gemmatimonadetes bacterium]|nr:preprotein translocase subunit YajC [Gemmatimonadota bacterium]MBT8403582.1 preprotein translocase subunit YajC [Gemmatimonadota bacterium]NNF38685.1 preprotein translocase subunit YajC [Gemmatimonadota bacterium]NNK61773.1 preprotein translocase subunit YajC [Gemmatimonadota bacterium]